mmetsp:Transcript_56124/g.180126  ORF Transcript_56124/g.180126 Transcript_56124/m.180126 type:complete len:336 (-) Transcript_56124:315-1322(-)
MAPGMAVERRAPVCSAAVENFVRNRHLNAHREKVSRSRTLVNNSWAPEELQRLQTSRRNVKREQLQGDRFANIERENLRLLGRMQEIEHRGPAKAAAHAVLAGASATALPAAVVRNASLPPSGAGSRLPARLQELRRIDVENQRLLKRLHGTKASVSLLRLDEEHRSQQQLMRMRCEHQRSEWKAPPPRRSASAAELQVLAPVETAELYAAGHGEPFEQEPPALELLELEPSGQEPQGLAVDTQEPGQADALSPAFGGAIPAASRALAEALLAGHFSSQSQAAAAEQDAEAAAAEAKDAAAAALRMATALDAGSEDLLAYGDVVQRLRSGSARGT